MKRTNTYILAPLALLLGLAACTREDSGMLLDGTQPLTLTASIEGSTTMRSTVNNTWDGGETIALQVDGDEWYEYTVDASGNMTGDYYWQQSNSSITVQGLYPATAVEEDEENLTWSVAADQTGDTYQTGDLLASDLQTVSYGSTANLAFYHQTAKVRVNVKAEGLPTVIEAAATDISLTLGDEHLVLDGTFTLPTAADDNGHWFGSWELGTASGTTTGAITPHSGTAATDCIATYEALVIPQTVESGTQLLTLTLTKDGTPYGPFLYTLPTATEWRAGHVYTYNVKISSTLEVSVSTGLEWSTGTDGSGEVTMPPDYEIEDEKTYIVYTAKGLMAWNQAAQNNLELNCILANDIDLSDINYTWTPVGSDYDNSYKGTFEGGGCTITGLTVNQNTNYVGLIGYLGSGGKVQNLTLDNVSITGNYAVGGVVGSNYYGTVTNCNVSGIISSTNDYVGGVVGSNYGIVTACTASSSVSGSSYAGGVVGYNSGTVTACYSLSDISGRFDSVGGVVGFNYDTVSACYHASGIVSGNWYVGGVAGLNRSTVNACYWSSDISEGIGLDYGSGSATFVDGSDTTWQDAVSAMNSAIGTPREWEYELLDGNDLPTLTKKSEE